MQYTASVADTAAPYSRLIFSALCTMQILLMYLAGLACASRAPRFLSVPVQCRLGARCVRLRSIEEFSCYVAHSF